MTSFGQEMSNGKRWLIIGGIWFLLNFIIERNILVALFGGATAVAIVSYLASRKASYGKAFFVGWLYGVIFWAVGGAIVGGLVGKVLGLFGGAIVGILAGMFFGLFTGVCFIVMRFVDKIVMRS